SHANNPRNEAGGVKPMNNSAAKARLAREMLRQMDRIVIARKLGEVDHVFILDRLMNGRAHPDRKGVKIERLKQLHGPAAWARSGERAPPGHTPFSSYRRCSSV